jgi:putative transcriptional regulator
MSSRYLQNNIKELRLLNQKMTQEKLALKVNLSRQTISAIESGKHSPNLEDAMNIAEIFNKHVEEVFFWSDQSKI